ncbi:GlxA family transcriptional regulator [Breoghania sp.]|uniref:GlxA family transcriptional regulator n=1 Tax=Breoghania sp. TaxID=2065378 RepID=UPI002AA6002E|nr:GlxA family transcriptional regulator [Breoghania sp.]
MSAVTGRKARNDKAGDRRTGNRLAGSRRPALSVGFLLTNNFTLTALSSFIDALRLAADEGDGSRPIRCRWHVLGEPDAPRKSSCGIAVAPDAPYDFDLSGLDYLVVVGGLLHRGPQLDAQGAACLARAAKAGIPLVGVCTGSFVLARSGLMQDRACCVSWYHFRDFIEEFPDLVPVAEQLFVEDRDRITCSGGAGVVDLAAHLIERHLGASAAQKAMHILQVDPGRAASQSQPPPPVGGPVVDDRVRRAMLMMEQNLGQPLAMEEIAARLAISTRQFERIFQSATGMSPNRFYRLLRLRYGLWMLKTSPRSVTDVAYEAGFADCAHFSRHFREVFGINPSQVRKQAETVDADLILPMSGGSAQRMQHDPRFYG